MMRVFVIGATGWIGGSITDAFLGAGHEVVGLARTADAAAQLTAKGAALVHGEMGDSVVLATTARDADAVVYTAAAPLDVTLTALNAAVAALDGSNKSLIYISGSSKYGDTGNAEPATEEMFVRRLATPALAGSPEHVTHTAAGRGIRGVVVVGAGILYGRDGGATPTFWLKDARERGAAWYIGAGTQRWSAVHVDDLARLVVRAAERAPAGSMFNAVNEAIPLHEAAAIAARATGAAGGAVSVPEASAREAWGASWAGMLAHDLRLSGDHARNALDWHPSALSFADDMLRGSYRATTQGGVVR